ncbi:MAG TPA: tetratricopeptide repeat protein [Terracidiphilus sp.]|jgi:tetratricopeptide (TPR) repeat protein|nr:tetratricopeptide repeat protein [Terracidiphilus sp.]
MGAGHSMSDMRPIPPPEQLPVPIKMTGIGNSHIAIKATPEAQAWFDQGLSLLHDFWDYESAKAFEQSIRVDPNCAMCWWGLAQALGMRGDDGVKSYVEHAMDEAERLKNHASRSDKLYIEAGKADLLRREQGHSAAIPALRKLVKKYPHDIEARIFLAEAVGDGYDENGEPKAGQKERIAILEGVLREAPNDSAANHYWIHAMEPGNHPERAIPSAALLASLAPASGHMVHMPGHIYYRVGDYTQAEHWFGASMTADETYMRDQHVAVDDDWNYVHNMMYAIANLLEQGKLSDANALSDHLSAARGQLSATLYIWSARDQMARINRRLPVALRTADWDTVLALLSQANLPEGDKTANLRFLAAELSDFATGMKALDNNDAVAAEAASDRMDAGLWRTKRATDTGSDAPKKNGEELAKKIAAAVSKPPADPISPDAIASPLIQALSVASLELHAGVLIAKGKLEQGKKEFASAIAAEKDLGYHEPPMYIRPVGENEAVALIRAKDYDGAKAAYEDALKERPNSGFALYGLALVRELAGDAPGARESYQAFLKAWSTADPTLPEVVHARKIVADTAVAAR